MRKSVPALERFNSFHIPEPNTGCWLWFGVALPNGYGVFTVGREGKVTINNKRPSPRKVLAHRFSYENYVGLIPVGLTIDHKCGVRCCVNPEHLEPMTTRGNTLRGTSPAAKQARQTHCLRGHELVGDNLLTAETNRGKRGCRMCANWRRRCYWAKSKERV